jgi:hypothetical protein
MELTQEEKSRILAEERYRLEAKRQIREEAPGCCGLSFHRGGFWRGFLLGIILSALVALVCAHHRRCDRDFRGGFAPGGQGHFQHQNWAPQEQGQKPECRK